jgi:hypothetical protein
MSLLADALPSAVNLSYIGDDVSEYSNAILLIVISAYCGPLFLLALARGIDIVYRAALGV